MLWSILVGKFIDLLASFWLKMLFIFLNTPSIFKVNRWNRNLTKLDMLTSSSSNMMDQTLLMNEHLKKKKTSMFFIFILLTPNVKSFFHTLSWTSKRNYFISGIYTKFMCPITFFYSHYCQKIGKKLNFSKNLKFLWTQLEGRVFGFSPAGPKTKADLPDSQQ